MLLGQTSRPKNGTTGVPARITTGRGTEGPENGKVPAKTGRDGWQLYV